MSVFGLQSTSVCEFTCSVSRDGSVSPNAAAVTGVVRGRRRRPSRTARAHGGAGSGGGDGGGGVAFPYFPAGDVVHSSRCSCHPVYPQRRRQAAVDGCSPPVPLHKSEAERGPPFGPLARASAAGWDSGWPLVRFVFVVGDNVGHASGNQRAGRHLGGAITCARVPVRARRRRQDQRVGHSRLAAGIPRGERAPAGGACPPTARRRHNGGGGAACGTPRRAAGPANRHPHPWRRPDAAAGAAQTVARRAAAVGADLTAASRNSSPHQRRVAPRGMMVGARRPPAAGSDQSVPPRRAPQNSFGGEPAPAVRRVAATAVAATAAAAATGGWVPAGPRRGDVGASPPPVMVVFHRPARGWVRWAGRRRRPCGSARAPPEPPPQTSRQRPWSCVYLAPNTVGGVVVADPPTHGNFPTPPPPPLLPVVVAGSPKYVFPSQPCIVGQASLPMYIPAPARPARAHAPGRHSAA